MHRCLQISEILHEVVEYLAADSRHKGTLANLACTSKLFLEPALDALWRDLDDLYPLVDCFPEDVLDAWSHPNYSSDDDINLTVNERTTLFRDFLDVRRLLRAPAWIRFQFYAPRVKSFEWAFYRATKICQALNSDRPSNYLLPNITHLAGTIRRPDEFGNMVPFLGPKLQSLTFIISSLQTNVFGLAPHAWVASSFGQLKFLCPQLEDVTFKNYVNSPFHYDGEYYEGMSQFICALPPIRAFWSDISITQRAFAALAMMPGLERFHASVGEDGIPHCQPLARYITNESTTEQDSMDIFFPALRSFALACTDHPVPAEELAELLLTMREPRPLTDFKVHGIYDGHGRDVRLVLNALASAARTDAVCTVECAAYNPFMLGPEESLPQPTGPIGMAEVIRPLHIFHSLRTLRIAALVHCATFDDDLVTSLARVFPLLERLALWGTFRDQSRITYAALKTLTALCPFLCEIGIPISPTAEPPGSASEMDLVGSAMERPVVLMNFGRKPPGRAEDVAAYFGALFPNGATVQDYYWLHWLNLPITYME
ncbi:hypothetical protein FA95DRAFT_135586 [Auriscalpium vulgare]|uniref:Uncharacterized protein n=1 Tax=Auriscalpium vulgare TaxID=40419 RepID=A0ACB8RM83_9AGAM|nr:hypothetical protein FA95DRAFT_135586 [Auriscalpium vulgare]